MFVVGGFGFEGRWERWLECPLESCPRVVRFDRKVERGFAGWMSNLIVLEDRRPARWWLLWLSESGWS